jgi:hypothetical protein
MINDARGAKKLYNTLDVDLSYFNGLKTGVVEILETI